jgi:hypothetical protein
MSCTVYYFPLRYRSVIRVDDNVNIKIPDNCVMLFLKVNLENLPHYDFKVPVKDIRKGLRQINQKSCMIVLRGKCITSKLRIVADDKDYFITNCFIKKINMKQAVIDSIEYKRDEYFKRIQRFSFGTKEVFENSCKVLNEYYKEAIDAIRNSPLDSLKQAWSVLKSLELSNWQVKNRFESRKNLIRPLHVIRDELAIACESDTIERDRIVNILRQALQLTMEIGVILQSSGFKPSTEINLGRHRLQNAFKENLVDIVDVRDEIQLQLNVYTDVVKNKMIVSMTKETERSVAKVKELFEEIKKTGFRELNFWPLTKINQHVEDLENEKEATEIMQTFIENFAGEFNGQLLFVSSELSDLSVFKRSHDLC